MNRILRVKERGFTLHGVRHGEFALSPDSIGIREFTGDFRTGSMYIIGHEYGAVCAVWADNEQDAINGAWDEDMLTCLAFEEEDAVDESGDDMPNVMRVGNESAPIDTSYLWIDTVRFDPVRDFQAILAIAAASSANEDTLCDRTEVKF